MDDLISRQAAIDALRYAQHRFTVADEAGGMGTVKWSEDVIYFAAAERVLSELPSAQPSTNCSEFPNNSDTISRQAAIDICRAPHMRNADCSDFEMAIMMLPPAQPEIIRCKDCKHWIPYDWMFSEVWQSKNIADYPEDEIGCNYCDMAMKANDFCSRGEKREVTE